MAITAVGICNSALIKIGCERISSLSDDTKAARLCNEQYEKLRDEVLEAHPWNFAIKRASIAADGSAPSWGYDYRYALPADFLRLLTLEYSDIEHKIENGYILTDQSGPLKIQYIFQCTDTSEFSNKFAEALACRLAADLAYAISQNNTLMQTMMAAYQQTLKEARTVDAQQGTPDVVEASDWELSRY